MREVDLNCMHSVGTDGRVPYERWTGRSHEIAELGDNTPFKINRTGSPRGEKLEAKWKERVASSASIGWRAKPLSARTEK